ncbi:MAG: ATP-dependent Clp protease ATP-binding subunit, partial [Bacteroidota bacterium]
SMLSPELKQAIEIAQAIAKENNNSFFTPSHLLKGIMHNEIGLAADLAVWGKDIHYIRDWADIRIEDTPKTSSLNGDPSGDDKVTSVLEVADVTRMKLEEELISPLAILITLCKTDIAFTQEQLKTLPLTEKELLESFLKDSSIQQAVESSTTSQNGMASPSSSNALLKYCIDKTEQAKQRKLDPIMGRDKETRNMIEILGRRMKPNPIIVGEPGVGKTALVEGFVQQIEAGEVPHQLKGARLFELDSGALIAGASYKGEIEDRLKKIIKEIKQFDKAILFIDEIHMLLDSAAGFGGAANLLKPELARGELTVIGATTIKEYREYFESDPAFSRRFDIVQVLEPDVNTAIRMIKNIVPKYTEHHELGISEGTVEEAVHLSRRYVNDKHLPDAALDLVDTTMSAMKIMGEVSLKEISHLAEELEEATTLEEGKCVYQQMQNRLSPVLIGQYEGTIEIDSFTSLESLQTQLTEAFEILKDFASQPKDEITPSDIAAVVANKSGIPIGKIQAEERERLLGIEDHLRKRVVGQDQALKVISEAILESRADLKKPGLPVGSFFFSGPTGTGKTELAKSLAEFLFNDEKALIRFDMSEFKESHSAALLYGSPPGYVGFKEGGLLVNKIRQKPYSIVLFDEIEKAHSSVYDVFLQILDEGRLTDKLGKEGDFSNAVILFTSNLGQEEIVS